jgi:alpha-N-arabinofuranosidase
MAASERMSLSVLDDWGVWENIPEEDEKRYGKLRQQSTMRSAVAAGLGLNTFNRQADNRQADRLHMCNIAQMVNVLQSLLLTDGPDGEHCVRTTTYHAFSLFKRHLQDCVASRDRRFVAPGSFASTSKSNKELVVTFVNPRHDSDLQVESTLKGSVADGDTSQVLHDANRNGYNSFDNPDRVVPKQQPIKVNGSKMQLD